MKSMNVWQRAAMSAMLATSAFLSHAAFAAEGDAPAPGPANAEHGRAISYTCLGCHGIKGYRNAYPNYRVPKLHGQHPEYIVAALKEYRTGDRSHPTMHAQAQSLSDQDMVDIAAYFAGTPVTAVAGSAPAQVPQAAAVCVACHGPDGVGLTPMYPTLAGQHDDYIERALHDYKYGGRKNPIMGTFAAQLNDRQIAELAAYYSTRKPSLSEPDRPYTSLGIKGR